jgi:KaiC/GvpD/RAD55 family RecA-like ATPase/5S rRNA maturation endonuclease (ribonuclease M5)
MSEISHQPCIVCDSTDAFSYNSDTGLFRCFSCAADNKSEKGLCFDGKTIEPFKYKSEEGYSVEPYYKDFRGIKAKTLEKHGAYFTKLDDKETVHYSYPSATKHKNLSIPKGAKGHITISGNMDKFYGQDDYQGGKILTITEGEEDRLSVIEMMGDYPTVSVPNATPSKEFWAKAIEYMGKFDKIYLSVDNDTAGDKLAQTFFRLLPGKVYRVDHGKHKDANDFLKAGDFAQYKTSWWNAQKIKPDTINTTAEDFLKLYDETPDYEYFKTGIDGLDEKMLGIHKSAFTLILAPTGIGKTELMRYLEYQCFLAGKPFAFCHGEETQLRSLLGLVSYDLKDNVTRKDLIEDKNREADVKASLEQFGKSEKCFQFQIRVDEGVDDIIEQIRFLVTAMGVEYIFLEPIQDFVSGNTTEKESMITDLANKMKRLAAEINVGIVVIAHANAEGDAKYCKSLTQSAAYEIILSREVDSDDPVEKNRMHVNVGRKNRTGGGSGPAGCLTFDVETYMLNPEYDSVPVIDRSKKVKVEPIKEDYEDEVPF